MNATTLTYWRITQAVLKVKMLKDFAMRKRKQQEEMVSKAVVVPAGPSSSMQHVIPMAIES